METNVIKLGGNACVRGKLFRFANGRHSIREPRVQYKGKIYVRKHQNDGSGRRAVDYVESGLSPTHVSARQVEVVFDAE